MQSCTRRTALILAAIILATAPALANAALVITEVQSQTTAGTASNINGDWWELTNTGPAGVNLENYAWTDTEDDLFGGAPQPNIFPSFVINPGQSIIILEEDSANEAAWRANWGIPASVEILSEDEMIAFLPPPDDDTFSGLGSSNDAVYLFSFDPMNLPATTLISSYGWDSNTRGTTFEASTSGEDLGLSVVREFGAVLAANGDIGSPGTASTGVPEPSSLLLVFLASVGSIYVRRGR